MRILCVLAVPLLLTSTKAAAADPHATFLGTQTYAAAADCPKLKRVADVASATTTLPPMPKSLSAKGFDGPDGLCRFTNISERYVDRIWTTSMTCSGGAPGRDEYRSQVWRKQTDGSFLMTEARDVTTWIACPPDVPASAAKRR